MNKKPALGVFAVAMITITSVDTIRNLPATALFGSPLIIFFIIACLFFLLPSALVAAELSAAWPETGGVYVWIKQAFGKRFGLLAIWFQWVENVVWYPTILSFIIGTAAYLISPELAQNKYLLVSVIIATFWTLTAINLSGIKASARFSEFCGIAGLIIPMILIISLGCLWYFSGKPIQIDFSPEAILPSFSDPGLLVSLTAVILTFSGMEIATVHGQDVKNPSRTYPIALLISVIVIFTTMLLGSLAIAIVVPKSNLSLVAGIMQAFTDFFSMYNMLWMVPVIGISIILGSLGSISNWIMAPSRGLLIALQDVQLAPFLHNENKHGAPATILIYQAVLVTLMCSVFLFMPNVNSSYWILTVMAAQLYMCMYLIFFAAAIYLRYKCPEHPRPFKIPGGKPGIWLVAGSGFAISLFNFGIGFFPPSDIDVGNITHYECILISGLVLMTCPPFVLYWHRYIKSANAYRAKSQGELNG